MIQLHVISKKPDQIKEIAEMLINEELITGVNVIDTASIHKSDKGEIEAVSTKMLIGRTKAILFNTIERLLKDKYGDSIPAIYGMPIIGMDLKHLGKLMREVKDV